MRIGRDEKVEKGRRDDRALWDACSGVSGGGGCIIVTAAGCAPIKVGGQPAYSVGSEGGVNEGGYEFCVVDHVKCF